MKNAKKIIRAKGFKIHPAGLRWDRRKGNKDRVRPILVIISNGKGVSIAGDRRQIGAEIRRIARQ